MCILDPRPVAGLKQIKDALVNLAGFDEVMGQHLEIVGMEALECNSRPALQTAAA